MAPEWRITGFEIWIMTIICGSFYRELCIGTKIGVVVFNHYKDLNCAIGGKFDSE